MSVPTLQDYNRNVKKMMENTDNGKEYDVNLNNKLRIKRSFVSSSMILSSSSTTLLFKCYKYAVIAAILVAWTKIPSGVAADVQLPQFNRTFESMPGLFGGKLKVDASIFAHLILVPNQPFLCPDELKRIQPRPEFYSANNNDNNSTGNNSSDGNNNSSNDGDIEFAYDEIEKFQVPEDGLPIGILVERGMCTFYEKAVMATKYGHAVQYIIVYDDEVSTDLVPMSSEFTTNITLLFVSSLSGHEIRNYIVRNFVMIGREGGKGKPDANEIESDEIGILVEIDGVSPILHKAPVLNMAAYFLVRKIAYPFRHHEHQTRCLLSLIVGWIKYKTSYYVTFSFLFKRFIGCYVRVSCFLNFLWLSIDLRAVGLDYRSARRVSSIFWENKYPHHLLFLLY